MRLLAGILLLTGCRPAPPVPVTPVEIIFAGTGEDCTVQIEGRTYLAIGQAEQVQAAL